MGSNSYLGKTKLGGNKPKTASSIASDKDLAARLKRGKIRRPSKMGDFGTKRIPDYTELAYKEAVSKLRYFLSGNYSPSVRSYGGSASIKNLDESDGDIDKKYYPSAVTEYRSRPRLTAKYTTLYADSLNNYNTAGNGSIGSKGVAPQAPHSAPVDVSSSTNPDVVHFIQKQEEYIEQLERESQYCRDELNNLLGKVKEVISENENLHEAQKNKLISKMFSYAGSETDDLDDIGDSTGIDSDHKKVSSPALGCLSTDAERTGVERRNEEISTNDISSFLRSASSLRISEQAALARGSNKLSPTKSRPKSRLRSTKLEGPNIVFESRISELEAQLAQAKINLKKVQDENNEYKHKLASGLVDNTCLDGFKRQIENLQRDKSSLELQISKLKMSLEKDGDLDSKFKRGYDVIEQQLRDERNNLETEVRRLKEDLSKERSKIRDLAGEGARRAIQERSAAEERYNVHFDELSHDLAAQYENVSKLQLELERHRREESELKREISMKNAAIEDLKMEIKNKTSSLQADLSQSHAEKASVEEELASARLALERQQRQAKLETNRLNSEIQSLRQRLDRADADLVHSRRENLRLSEQIASLEKEINMKNLTPISPEKNKKEKEFSSMLENIENKHAKTVSELESMIHSQNSLMEKLTGECRTLTDKLDDANRRHKTELGTLYRQVEQLSKTVQLTNAPDNSYQAQATHPAYTNENQYSEPRAGPEYPVDTIRQPSISRQQSVTELSENRGHLNARPIISRQSSRASVVSKVQEPEPAPVYHDDRVADKVSPVKVSDTNHSLQEQLYDENYSHQKQEPNYEEGQLEQNYDQQQHKQKYEAAQPEQNYEQEDQNFDQTYAQDYVDQNQYPNQGYEQQNYDPNYTGQYQEGYDYTNQQYEQNQQYSDYVDQNYDNTNPNSTHNLNEGYQHDDPNFTQNTQDAVAYDPNHLNYTQKMETQNENYPTDTNLSNEKQPKSQSEIVAQSKTNEQAKPSTIQENKKNNSPTQRKLRS